MIYITARNANLAILIQVRVSGLFQMHYRDSTHAHPMHFNLKCFGNRIIKRNNSLIFIDREKTQILPNHIVGKTKINQLLDII